MEDAAIACFNPLLCCLNLLYPDAIKQVYMLCFSMLSVYAAKD